MAKTTTKKNTRSSKSSKTSKSSKQTKKSSIFSKINWGSKKVQLLLVVLIFGVIGGGYYVYKSSAATAIESRMASTLGGGSNVTDVYSDNKRGQVVKRLRPGQSIQWDIPGNRMSNRSRYMLCAIARGEGGYPGLRMQAQQLMGARLTVGGGLNASWTRHTQSAKNFKQVCTTYFTGFGRDKLRFKITNTGNHSALIELMSLHRQ